MGGFVKMDVLYKERISFLSSSAGLAPNIVMEAIDSDVIKAYVELGLGIAAQDGEMRGGRREQRLAREQHQPGIAQGVKRLLRDDTYAYRFHEACRADFSEASVRKLSQREA